MGTAIKLTGGVDRLDTPAASIMHRKMHVVS
jgi:hypothetical protein